MKTNVNLSTGMPLSRNNANPIVNRKNGDHKYLLHHRKRKRNEL